MPALIYFSALFSLLAVAHPHTAPHVTSLTNKTVKYQTTKQHYVILKRGEVTAVIVDNAAVDDQVLPKHRAGYNGLASLTHKKQPVNLFVPSIAGLNFEHIHDGTKAGLKEKFEPRKNDMQIRIVNEQTVELYQPPTKNFQLESCGRYQLLEDGTIEYTFECIPHQKTFKQGYIGLFWASYIHQPKDKSIWFKGQRVNSRMVTRWVNGITPKHGVKSTHSPYNMQLPAVNDDFPLSLVNHPSKMTYASPWYYGVSHNMAFVQMFRPQDRIWIAQSPSGGGKGNPAWDFQWFIPDYKVGEAYGFVMRASYFPYKSQKQVEEVTKKDRQQLARKNGGSD